MGDNLTDDVRIRGIEEVISPKSCLLYTSDAADE